MDSHIIVVNFISESDLSMYGLGQNAICQNMEEVGALIKIRIHTLIEHKKENTIGKNIKITNFRTQVIPHSTCVVFVSICCILVFCT